jgi:P27 family predicted phage terminase small subunit
MRGRKPKPATLKLLRGNPGRRPLNHSEPRPPAAIPDCPGHLHGEALAEFHRITSELHAIGLLTRADRAALTAYCVAWGRWVEAEIKVRKKGAVITTHTGTQKQNPWLAIAHEELGIMHKFLVEFGLSPSSRTRLKVEAAKEKSGFDSFLEA